MKFLRLIRKVLTILHTIMYLSQMNISVRLPMELINGIHLRLLLPLESQDFLLVFNLHLDSMVP